MQSIDNDLSLLLTLDMIIIRYVHWCQSLEGKSTTELKLTRVNYSKCLIRYYNIM